MKSWHEDWVPTNELMAAQPDLFRQMLIQQAMPRVSAAPESNFGALPAGLPPELQARLAELSLLYGVPFGYLIPHESMLPPESIRFFQLDENWMFSLLDGALSPGRALALDIDFDRVLIGGIYASATAQNYQVRQHLQGKSPEDMTQNQTTCSGFIMRSIVVRSWRGLEFKASAGQQMLTILRLETLGADVLLGLFSGVVDRLEIRQPPEGLHFGLSSEPEGGYGKTLRDMQSGSLNGQRIKLSAINGERVIDFSRVATEIGQQINQEITSAGLALQMIQNPYTAIIQQHQGDVSEPENHRVRKQNGQ